MNEHANTSKRIEENDFPFHDSESTIKHGRRAGTYSGGSTPSNSQKIPEKLDYFVPNLNHIDLSILDTSKNQTITYQQYYNNFQETVKENQQSEDIYNPSILESGRRSRLENISESFNELIASLTTNTPKKTTTDNKTSDNTKLIEIENKISHLTNDVASKLIFDDSFKNKIQKNRKIISTPSKRMRYRKFKYKQGLSTGSRKDNAKNSRKVSDEDVFIIPELPSGLKLTINILNTWGDKYYIGLNGIELFGSDGTVIQVRKIQALDINVLPECKDDPRVVTNLIDGVNRTHDDRHLWLAPFEPGRNHEIFIEFQKHTVLAMMRIWNYNKSRIHSYRGARFVVISLDDVIIFKGEIAQACGSVSGNIESFGDTILFTTNESILEKISHNDEAFISLMNSSNFESDKIDRPSTATKPEELPQRPHTHAFIKRSENDGQTKSSLIPARRIDLVFICNWGRPDSIGLTGVEVVGENSSIQLSEKNIFSNVGNVDGLIDGENLTIDPKHMWSVKYQENIGVTIVFQDITYVAGIRIWNYNESIESSFTGVRVLKIFIDNKPVLNDNDCNFILRRAPGNVHYDYVQEIDFINDVELQCSEPVYDFKNVKKYSSIGSYEQPITPEGFVFQIVVYTTWGDQYYVGLNGIELYDDLGRKILLSENNICAHPESVNVLLNVSGDVRTPDKLIDGVNDNQDGSHSWLAPIIPKYLNRIYIVLDRPVTVSVIKLWNYYKTPSRGVKEFGILVDDLLVYNGILDKATEKSIIKYRTILFTNNMDVIRKERKSLIKHNNDSQGTILTNDKHRTTTGGSLPGADQSMRPFTSVNQFRGNSSQSN